jgi:6-phospho-beta-glucosidase
VKTVVLGGGGFRVPLMHRALLASSLDVDELVLYDTDADRLAVLADVLRGDGPTIRATTDLHDAVDGADLIFSALRIGGVDGRVADERDALDLGLIGQETVGAGGLAAALRAVPVVDHIARVVAERAPDAWVVSMTNPAGVVTEAMSAVLGRRVIGVCDSPVALIRRACAALDVDPGPSLASVTGRVDVDYLGLNHLGWLRSVRVDGAELLPRLVGDPQRLARIEEGRLFGPDLIAALGTLPNEYLYWYYERAQAFRSLVAPGRTRGEHVRDRQRDFYAAAAADPPRAAALWQDANDERNRSYFAELREGERDEADIAVGGYETVALALAEALCGGISTRLVLNVPNGDTVAALPADAVIETVCVADGTGATPERAAEPSPHELGLMAAVKDCEQSIIRAGLTGSREAAYRAFALHPLVASGALAAELVTRAEARGLFAAG